MKAETPVVRERIDAVLVLSVGHLKIQAAIHRIRDVFLRDKPQLYLLGFKGILRELEFRGEAREICPGPIVVPPELRFRAFVGGKVLIEKAQLEPAQTEGEVVGEEGA